MSGRASTALAHPLAPARQRLTDISSELRSFAITTYTCAPDALARHLPAGFEPELVSIDGAPRALVSAVSFVNTRFYVGFAPFVKLTCAQTNFRAYVRRDGASAVWFFATSLGSRFVALPRHAWRFPWHHVQAECEAEWEGEHLARLSWRGRAAEGEERLDARGTGETLDRLPGFDEPAEARRVLTHPLTGYLRRRDGLVVTYGVSHAHLDMELATASDARHEVFERAGVVAPGQAPHSVLVQRATHFIVQLPPRALRPQPDARRLGP